MGTIGEFTSGNYWWIHLLIILEIWLNKRGRAGVICRKVFEYTKDDAGVLAWLDPQVD